jgi:hypothetical protein
MRIRNVRQEFGAHLQPVQPGTRTTGKSEWKHYADGTFRIRISIRNIPLPPSSVIELLLDGAQIAQLQVQGNKARIDRENMTSQGISAVRAGQTRHIRSKDIVLAKGLE